MKKKVYIYSESHFKGSYYYRGDVIKKYSTIFDISSNVDFENKKIENFSDALDKMLVADMIILIRPGSEEILQSANKLKASGKIIISDNDDLFSEIDEENSSYKMSGGFAKINTEIAKISTACITTTPYLQKKLYDINPNTFVFPNYLDFDVFSQNINLKKKNDSFLRIGISGSVVNTENLNSFLPMLKKIHDKHRNIIFVFFGGDAKMDTELNKNFPIRAELIEKVTFDKYAKVLAETNLDFVLIFRKDNIFNRCKSNCKFLEMSALKIPVIAQGFTDKESPYQKDIVDEENGFIAIDQDSWQEKIEHLIENPQLLSRIGSAAYDYVKKNYNIKDKIFEWENLIRKIMDSSNLSKERIMKNEANKINFYLKIKKFFIKK